MKVTCLLICLASASLVTTPALAREADQPNNSAQTTKVAQQASIPFANNGGIWDWRADGENAVYFEDSFGHWYKAKLFMPAFDLPFVQFIGIDTSPGGSLNRWSAIYVRGQRYPFMSFTRVAGPTDRRAT